MDGAYRRPAQIYTTGRVTPRVRIRPTGTALVVCDLLADERYWVFAEPLSWVQPTGKRETTTVRCHYLPQPRQIFSRFVKAKTSSRPTASRTLKMTCAIYLPLHGQVRRRLHEDSAIVVAPDVHDTTM